MRFFITLTFALSFLKVFAFQIDVVDSIQAPYGASGVAWDGKSIWCGSYGGVDYYYKLDPATGQVLASFHNPPGYYGCYGLAWNGEYLWYLNSDPWGKKVYKLDTLGNTEGSFDIHEYRAGMTWDGEYLWIGAYYEPDGYIFKFTTTGDSVFGFPSPEHQPWGLAWDGEYLWNCDTWAQGEQGMIFKIDPKDGALIESFISPRRRPQGLAWDGEYMWMAARTAAPEHYFLYKLKGEFGIQSPCASFNSSDFLSITPNPFNQFSVIDYQLPVESKISLKIYDLTGRLVKTLIDEKKKLGTYSVKWDGKDVTGKYVESGVYFCQLTIGDNEVRPQSVTKKVIVMR